MSSTESAPSSPRLSLICPTLGRSTYAALLEAVLAYIGPEDEFITVGDGPRPNIRAQVEAVNDPRIRYLELPAWTNDWGCSPCDAGIANAKGDMVWFVGDDDMVESDVFEKIRTAVTGATDRVHIFAMKHTGNILKGSIQLAAVSGQQIVCPFPDRLPKMADFDPMAPASDWQFISKVTGKFGHPIFHDEVICIMPYMNQGEIF